MIVEASLNHPESVNRTNFDCIENGLPSVCMDLTLCFSYKGKEVPGYIGKGTFTKLIECVLYPLSSLSSFEPSLCVTTEDCFRAGESSHLVHLSSPSFRCSHSSNLRVGHVKRLLLFRGYDQQIKCITCCMIQSELTALNR